MRGGSSPPGHKTASTPGHGSTWPRPRALGSRVISADPLPLGSLETSLSDASAQGSASPVSSRPPSQGSGLGAPGQVGTGPQGAHFAGNHGGKGFIRSPAPPPWKRHSPGGEFRGSSCHQNLRAPRSGLHMLCVLRMPVRPGHGMRHGHCMCVMCPGRGMRHVPRTWQAPWALRVRHVPRTWHAPWALRVCHLPRTWHVPWALHVRPGRGTRDKYCP